MLSTSIASYWKFYEARSHTFSSSNIFLFLFFDIKTRHDELTEGERVKIFLFKCDLQYIHPMSIVGYQSLHVEHVELLYAWTGPVHAAMSLHWSDHAYAVYLYMKSLKRLIDKENHVLYQLGLLTIIILLCRKFYYVTELLINYFIPWIFY